MIGNIDYHCRSAGTIELLDAGPVLAVADPLIGGAELEHAEGWVVLTVAIVSPGSESFRCGNGIPVNPHFAVRDAPDADIVILPELWLGPGEHLGGRYDELLD